MNTVVLFGSSGSLGSYISEQLSQNYHVVKIGRKGPNGIDFTSVNSEKLTRILDGTQIDHIIFAQGLNPEFSPFDDAGDQPMDMWKINISSVTVILSALNLSLSKGCSVTFFSSVAKYKGSYDPHYAAVKGAIPSYALSLKRHFSDCRFNIISLGLVQGTRVHNGMTPDFVRRHQEAMFGEKLVRPSTVVKALQLLLECSEFHLSEIKIDGGVTNSF